MFYTLSNFTFTSALFITVQDFTYLSSERYIQFASTSSPWYEWLATKHYHKIPDKGSLLNVSKKGLVLYESSTVPAVMWVCTTQRTHFTYLTRARKHTSQHEHEQSRALSSWSSRSVRKASANPADCFAFVRRLVEVKVKKSGDRKISSVIVSVRAAMWFQYHTYHRILSGKSSHSPYWASVVADSKAMIGNTSEREQSQQQQVERRQEQQQVGAPAALAGRARLHRLW